jgi:hypothetical protein
MKTRHLAIVLMIILVFGCNDNNTKFGKAIITDIIPVYENANIYFPHDYFMKSDYLEHPIEVTKTDNQIMISNIFNDGFSGHYVSFKIDKKFNIIGVSFHDWTDMLDGSETKHTIEKVILSFNNNPFENQNFIGFYTLQIKHNFFAGKLLASEGVKDTTYYSIFNGKFKIYNKEEMIKGEKWIIDQNEIKFGIKDSLGVYYSPDKFARFNHDENLLTKALDELKVKKGEINDTTRFFITLSFIVDENGSVDKDKIYIREIDISENLMQKIKNSKLIFENWNPAEYKGEKVKSEVNLRIRIEK